MAELATMIPSMLLKGAHTIRDQWTLGLTCEIQSPIRSPDGRGGEKTTWLSIGFFQCRMDPIESGSMSPNFIDATKRIFGLSLPHDGPRLGIGWRVIIDDVVYTIENAHDFDVEAIIRRYDVSITEANWTKRAQSAAVRDDDWPIGTPDTNMASTRIYPNGNTNWANWNQWSITTVLDDNQLGDQISTTQAFGYIAIRFAFDKPQMASAIRLQMFCSNYDINQIGASPAHESIEPFELQFGTLLNFVALDGMQWRDITYHLDSRFTNREWSVLGIGISFSDPNSLIADARCLDPRGEVID